MTTRRWYVKGEGCALCAFDMPNSGGQAQIPIPKRHSGPKNACAAARFCPLFYPLGKCRSPSICPRAETQTETTLNLLPSLFCLANRQLRGANLGPKSFALPFALPAHADPLPFPSSPNPNTVCPVLYALLLVVDDVADNALLALALAHNARCRTRNTNHARFCGSTYKDTKRAQLDKQRQ